MQVFWNKRRIDPGGLNIKKKEKIIKEALVLVTFVDGNTKLCQYSLRYNLPFGKQEMRKWIREKHKDKPIKEIKFLDAKEFELYKFVAEKMLKRRSEH